jgi:ribonuclease HI
VGNGPGAVTSTSTGARELIAIFADESCIGNGREGSNPGGAAGVVEYITRRGELVRRDFWVSEPATTNNRMALRSVIEAFTLLGAKRNNFDVVFRSDSQYLIRGMTEWLHSWAARGWRRKGGPIENLALWDAAIRAVGDHRVQWGWVRGHDGHPQNAYADHLATGAAARLDTSGGLVDSRFDAWIAAEREARRINVDPEPFPSRESFRPSRPLPRPPGAQSALAATLLPGKS